MKLALFDVDGTLVDSRAMITASIVEAFSATGLVLPPRETLMDFVGLSLVDAMRGLAPAASDADHHRLADAYKEAFWGFRSRGDHLEDLFDGARELLTNLHGRDDVLLGIATGKSRRGVAHLLAAQKLEGWFATVQTSDDHPSKPHPSMVVQALSETGVRPEDAIVIGDTSFDIGMARAAGAGAIGVTWGNHPMGELEHAGAHVIVSDFKQLASALESLWQERRG
ncbi:HAD-IA family hydrolase [Aestuariivirga sp.]|uniref:HAD-IA family hydrolase n=1 Tax=Aestuariivirga sp. TaxID=2650926 RepID=UPI0039E704F4